MRIILTVVLFIISTFFYGCYEKEKLMSPIKNNLPTHFQKVGDDFAAAIKQTIYNFNEMGIDYSNIESMDVLRDKFYKDYIVANPIMTKCPISDINQLLNIDAATLNARVENLTPI